MTHQVGYKAKQILQPGYVYAPYIPIYRTPGMAFADMLPTLVSFVARMFCCGKERNMKIKLRAVAGDKGGKWTADLYSPEVKAWMVFSMEEEWSSEGQIGQFKVYDPGKSIPILNSRHLAGMADYQQPPEKKEIGGWFIYDGDTIMKIEPPQIPDGEVKVDINMLDRREFDAFVIEFDKQATRYLAEKEGD